MTKIIKITVAFYHRFKKFIKGKLKDYGLSLIYGYEYDYYYKKKKDNDKGLRIM